MQFSSKQSRLTGNGRLLLETLYNPGLPHAASGPKINRLGKRTFVSVGNPAKATRAIFDSIPNEHYEFL